MKCINCDKELTEDAIRIYKSFCSLPCKNQHEKNKLFGFEEIPEISSSNKGALGEYAVAVDLIRRGFKVFKAITPGAAFDLVIEYNEKLLRVEVKTGRRNKDTGTLYYGKTDHNRYNILAVYDLGTGDTWYEFKGHDINDLRA